MLRFLAEDLAKEFDSVLQAILRSLSPSAARREHGSVHARQVVREGNGLGLTTSTIRRRLRDNVSGALVA